MAITVGSLIDIQLRYIYLSQQMMNTFSYAVFELAGVPTAANYGEAWWNAVKTTTRALQQSGSGDTFISVVVRELNNPTGEYGEFDIPAGERAGTRSAPTQSQQLPAFTAAGARLTVSSRLTRPGQKRVPFLAEEDNVGGVLQTAYKALFQSWLNVITSPFVLGAPALGVILNPVVTRRDAQGTVLASQDITGYVVNSYVTSQNSRKPGRGI